MLSLTRRVGEEIVIGDPRNPLGVIRIVDVHGDKVRLSFDFPRGVDINRRELAEQKARQQSEADGPAPATSGAAAPPAAAEPKPAAPPATPPAR